MSDTEPREKQQGGGEQPEAAAPRSASNLMFIGLCLVALLAGAGVPLFLGGDTEECYLEDLFGM